MKEDLLGHRQTTIAIIIGSFIVWTTMIVFYFYFRGGLK